MFITTAGGSGWVPERHLSMDRPLARVVHAYDTQELAASSGATLKLIEDDPESGWSWCVRDDGQAGWIPRRALGIQG